MTRRISSMDRRMQQGDFIRMALSVEKKLFGVEETIDLGVIEAVLIRGTERYWLLTNSEHLGGNQIAASCHYRPEDFGMEYSWIAQNSCTRSPREMLDQFENLTIGFVAIVDGGQCPECTITDSDEAYTTPTASTDTATEFIAKGYTKDNLYTGQRSYHYGVTMNTPLKDNYEFRVGVELEVEFNNDDLRDDFNEKPSNWFYREHDGSLGSYGCEIITIPLLPKDAKSKDFWKPLVDDLRGKASSWDNNRCGLHVHIGREAFGKTAEERSETEGKLLFLYHHIVKDTAFNIKVYGRTQSYNEHDGKTDVGGAVALLGGERLFRDKDIAKKVGDAMKERAGNTRYFDINTTNPDTIEFRKGRGSINEARIAMVVEYCLLLVRFARRSPWTGISAMRWRDFLRFNAKSEMLKSLIEEYL